MRLTQHFSLVPDVDVVAVAVVVDGNAFDCDDVAAVADVNVVADDVADIDYDDHWDDAVDAKDVVADYVADGYLKKWLPLLRSSLVHRNRCCANYWNCCSNCSTMSIATTLSALFPIANY